MCSNLMHKNLTFLLSSFHWCAIFKQLLYFSTTWMWDFGWHGGAKSGVLASHSDATVHCATFSRSLGMNRAPHLRLWVSRWTQAARGEDRLFKEQLEEWVRCCLGEHFRRSAPMHYGHGKTDRGLVSYETVIVRGWVLKDQMTAWSITDTQ